MIEGDERMMPTRPPGPRGEHSGIVNYEAWQADMFGFLRALAERYGDVVGFDLGRSPCILVNGASQVRELLFEREACLRKPEFVKDSNRGHWGDGLTTLEGSAWRAHRQALRPSFRSATRVAIVCRSWPNMHGGHARCLGARVARRSSIWPGTAHPHGPDRRAVVLDAEWNRPRNERRPLRGGSVRRSVRGRLRQQRPAAIRRALWSWCGPARRAGWTRRYASSTSASRAAKDAETSSRTWFRRGFLTAQRLTRDEIVGEVIQMLYAGHLTIPSSLVNFWRDIDVTDVDADIAAEADRLCATGIPESPALPGVLLPGRAEREHASPPAGPDPLSRGGERVRAGWVRVRAAIPPSG